MKQTKHIMRLEKKLEILLRNLEEQCQKTYQDQKKALNKLKKNN